MTRAHADGGSEAIDALSDGEVRPRPGKPASLPDLLHQSAALNSPVRGLLRIPIMDPALILAGVAVAPFIGAIMFGPYILRKLNRRQRRKRRMAGEDV